MRADAHTLQQLHDLFLSWLDQEVTANRCAPRTRAYYAQQLGRFVAKVGGDRPCADLVAFDLERAKTGWHSVQSVQRLFNWAVDAELVQHNPFKRVKRPALGQRQRVLTLQELAKLLRACSQPLRRFLLAQRLTLGRPQEIRALRWSHYRPDLHAFLLAEFKGKGKRRDQARFRVLVVVPRLARMLDRLRRPGQAGDGHIFTNARGRPWTSNAVRLAMRRAAARAGLQRAGDERVVAYTVRHTAATEATANGVQDRLLAELMGHADSRTTARYQHLRTEHLVAAGELATARKRA